MRGRYRPYFFAREYERLVIQQGRCRLGEKPYRPLFRVLDYSSEGWRTATKSWITGEVSELMSLPEFHYYLSLHVPGKAVLDIATQHALPPDESLTAVRQLGAEAEWRGLTHPSRNGEPIIMSTDFVVLFQTSAVGTWQPVSIKREQDLNRRVEEKLMIEAEVWRRRGTTLKLVLDTDLDMVEIKNVRLVFDRHDPAKLPCDERTTNEVRSWLSPHIETGEPLGRACQRCDEMLDLCEGTALAVAYHCIIRGYWPVDFKTPITPSRPLTLK